MDVRLRVTQGKAFSKLAAALIVATSLAGCSSGAFSPSSSSSGPLFTGSTQTASQADLNQSMPGTLSGPAAQSDSRYLPPVDVGARPSDAMTTGSISPAQQNLAVGQGTTPSVTTQDLPVLPQSTTSGSQPEMQAQQNVTPLFRDNAVPTQATTNSQPNLTVVPDNAFQHTIERGESLYAIARRYDVTTDAIVRANNLDAPDQIYVGQKIFIPGRADLLAARAPQQTQSVDQTTTASIQPVQPTQPQTPVQQVAPAQEEMRVANVETPSASAAESFRWPIQGRVIVDFNASRQTGINIEAPEGAAVRSSENGTVIYVGNGVEGYGNLVLIRHANGYVSAYAHLKDVTVAKDDVVTRGDTIGTVGMSGSVNRPQLHFELRQGATPVDPMPLLAG